MTTTGDHKCMIPPAGWYCTREPGHEGPCAAYEEKKKITHVECKTYTNFTPLFGACAEQLDAFNKWKALHDATHIPEGRKTRPIGAIGGAYTWEFTPTSLGTVTVVRCACGEGIDVTDYDW